MTASFETTTTAPSAATLSPRERVAARIDNQIANGAKGEHILQIIERQTLGFSAEHKKLAFITARLLSDDDLAEGKAA